MCREEDVRGVLLCKDLMTVDQILMVDGWIWMWWCLYALKVRVMKLSVAWPFSRHSLGVDECG